MSYKKLPIIVLISNNGSNLQAIINAIYNGLPIKIQAVISNRATAYGLKRAQQVNIPIHIISHKKFQSVTYFEKILIKTIDRYQPKLIVLAGFMHKLGKVFVNHYHDRIINIHPSLLPKYTGLNTHNRVLVAEELEHGVSVHYVTEDLDSGPLICQTRFQITTHDTMKTLKDHVHALEQIIYPKVLSWFSTGRLILQDNRVLLDGKLLPKSGKQYWF